MPNHSLHSAQKTSTIPLKICQSHVASEGRSLGREVEPRGVHDKSSQNWLTLIGGTTSRRRRWEGKGGAQKARRRRARKTRSGGWNRKPRSSATMKTKVLCTTHRGSVRSSRRMQCASIRKSNRWMLLTLLTGAPSVPATDAQLTWQATRSSDITNTCPPPCLHLPATPTQAQFHNKHCCRSYDRSLRLLKHSTDHSTDPGREKCPAAGDNSHCSATVAVALSL